MKFVISLFVLLSLAACSSTYLISNKGSSMVVRYRESEGLKRTFFGHRQVDGFLAVFRRAVPLEGAKPGELKTDLIFTHIDESGVASEYVLHPDGELFHDGKWFVVDQDWLYRWQSEYDPKNSKRPNKRTTYNSGTSPLRI